MLGDPHRLGLTFTSVGFCADPELPVTSLVSDESCGEPRFRKGIASPRRPCAPRSSRPSKPFTLPLVKGYFLGNPSFLRLRRTSHTSLGLPLWKYCSPTAIHN